jgi:hypothetical protein
MVDLNRPILHRLRNQDPPYQWRATQDWEDPAMAEAGHKVRTSYIAGFHNEAAAIAHGERNGWI